MSPDRSRPDDALDYLIENPVENVDGVYHLRMPGGLRPLYLGGVPVTSFAPGWRPVALFLGLAPLTLLEFSHENGGSGYWVLDHKLLHIGSSVADLPADLRTVVRACVMPILREIMAMVEQPGPVSFSAATKAFLRLSESTRQQFAALFIAELLPMPTIYPAADLVAGQAPMVLAATGARHCLSGPHLRAGLEADWQDWLIGAARTGTLLWPSPVDGDPLPCRGSLMFDDFMFAYRFVDERFGLVFYVLASEHKSCTGGVWLPSCGVLAVKDDLARPLGEKMRVQLPHRMVNHVLSWTELLRQYFATPPTHLSNLLRGEPAVHIGHQLWNELTGIEDLLERVPDPKLTHIVLGRHGRLELYGPIDEIFPALNGHVRRDLDSLSALMADSYRSGRIVFRITREYVPASLRSRLLADVRRRETALADLPAGPIMMIGLRVENRTLADLDGFLARLVAMVAQNYPTLNLVFDGHNADGEGGQPISSHGESMAATAPATVERRIVDTLRHDFPLRREQIFDTIMQPVGTSLAWAQASIGFVSIWGASLAKYRWVANLPGFIISSAHNLNYRTDLGIYNDPLYMEDPSPVEFVAAALVTDLPHAPQLVPVGGAQPSFSNFELDETAVLIDIRRFIDGCLQARAPVSPQTAGSW